MGTVIDLAPALWRGSWRYKVYISELIHAERRLSMVEGTAQRRSSLTMCSPTGARYSQPPAVEPLRRYSTVSVAAMLAGFRFVDTCGRRLAHGIAALLRFPRSGYSVLAPATRYTSVHSSRSDRFPERTSTSWTAAGPAKKLSFL
jgi:hypothetical protein